MSCADLPTLALPSRLLPAPPQEGLVYGLLSTVSNVGKSLPNAVSNQLFQPALSDEANYIAAKGGDQPCFRVVVALSFVVGSGTPRRATKPRRDAKPLRLADLSQPVTPLTRLPPARPNAQASPSAHSW